MSDALVVYFSRSGVTEKLAYQLAKRLGADVERVVPIAPYAGVGGYLRGAWQAVRGESPPVRAASEVARARHRLVVIASPVWAAGLAAPMRSYLRSFCGRMDRVAAFWVSGSGAPYRGVGAEIERLTGKTPMAMISFSQREVERGLADGRLKTFAKTLGAPSFLQRLHNIARSPERVAS